MIQWGGSINAKGGSEGRFGRKPMAKTRGKKGKIPYGPGGEAKPHDIEKEGERGAAKNERNKSQKSFCLEREITEFLKNAGGAGGGGGRGNNRRKNQRRRKKGKRRFFQKKTRQPHYLYMGVAPKNKRTICMVQNPIQNWWFWRQLRGSGGSSRKKMLNL